MADSRYTVFSVLSDIEHDNAYSNLTLSDYIPEKMDDRDKAFVFTLVKTVLERKITIDYNLTLYLSQPLKKLKPQVLTILRMGVAQILFMDKIPDSASVNESVKLSKKCGCGFASGLINAVLHKIVKFRLKLPEKDNIVLYLSVKYSYSDFITNLFIKYYGIDITEKIMASSVENRILYVKKNNLNDCKDFNFIKNDYINKISCQNDYINNVKDNCYEYSNSEFVGGNELFKKGCFHIQDLSSQLACSALEAKSGETVIDVCSAPGGKSFTIAEMMNNRGKVISCDIHSHKIRLIEDGKNRLGLSIISPVLNDASVFNSDFPEADKVLCDVPCSGFGVVSKKPEIKYKSESDCKGLYDLQLKILEVSSQYVKHGGRLVYSTCTLNPYENIVNVNGFLKKHKDFHTIRILDGIECLRENESVTILPYSYNSDGFFVTAFERD